jgi:hypothetical protein
MRFSIFSLTSTCTFCHFLDISCPCESSFLLVIPTTKKEDFLLGYHSLEMLLSPGGKQKLQDNYSTNVNCTLIDQNWKKTMRVHFMHELRLRTCHVNIVLSGWRFFLIKHLSKEQKYFFFCVNNCKNSSCFKVFCLLIKPSPTYSFVCVFFFLSRISLYKRLTSMTHLCVDKITQFFFFLLVWQID